MAKPLSPALIKLITTYQVSQQNIINTIATKEAKGNSTYYSKQLLASITQELNLLDIFTAEWMNNEIPKAYGVGVDDAYQSFRDAGLDVTKVAASQAIVKNLVDNAVGDLSDATRYVGRRIKDDLRQAGLDAIAQKLSSGETVKATKAGLIQRMTDKGITAIVDSRGRNIQMDVYAEMLSRTATAEATNQGTLQETQDLGNDLVRMTTTYTTCKVCKPLENRIYSITGKDKRYPKLSIAFPSGFKIIHPRCTHRLANYHEKLDPDAKANREMSNRPFEIDKEQQASIDRYNAQQKVKQIRRNDRRDWEQSVLNDPKNTPKSFSAYRSKMNKQRAAEAEKAKGDSK